MNTKALLALLAASVILGCGSDSGSEMPATDAAVVADAQPGGKAGTGGAVAGQGGGTMGVDGGAGGAIPGAGGAGGAGQSGAGGTPLTGGAPGSGGATVGSGGAGGATPVLACGSNTHLATSGCGYLITAGQWEYLWKGDIACGTCTAVNKPITGCKIAPAPPMTSNPPPQPDFILCVADCRAECCFKRPESVCTSDANCCAPLRCVDNGAGRSKTCR